MQTNSGAPKAYINWILFDEQFKYYSGSFQQVGASGTTTIHLKNGLTVGKNGYLYIYTSNEATNIDVFFDNLQVTHIRGPLLEETHYYPFGLTMAGISSEALNFGQPENKKKYNGIELDKDLELNAYEAQFRDLDPQTARWWQIDPETDGYENLSPYASMYDDPTMISDPLGNEGETCCDGTILGDLIQGGKNLLISASGMLDGALNTVSGGLISSDPFNFRQTLSDDEKGWFDGGVRVGKIIPLVSSPTSGKVSETFEPVPAGNARLKTNEPVQEPQPNTQAKAGDYSNLKDSKSVGPGKKYTPAQKRNILTQNKNQNGGVLKDDVTGETLNPPKRNVKGQKADMNQAEVDHKNARSKGGSNSYSNASVRSKRNNIKKSNKDE